MHFFSSAWYQNDRYIKQKDYLCLCFTEHVSDTESSLGLLITAAANKHELHLKLSDWSGSYKDFFVSVNYWFFKAAFLERCWILASHGSILNYTVFTDFFPC